MALVLGALVVNAQRTPVKVSDLPKGVADSIQKEYSGYTIKESARNVENNVTTYEVVVAKGTDQKTLHFDNQGKSLKSKGTWDMDKEKSKTPNTDMDKSKTPSSTSPSSTTPSSTTPSSTTPSSTTPSSTTPSSTPSPSTESK